MPSEVENKQDTLLLMYIAAALTTLTLLGTLVTFAGLHHSIDMTVRLPYASVVQFALLYVAARVVAKILVKVVGMPLMVARMLRTNTPSTLKEKGEAGLKVVERLKIRLATAKKLNLEGEGGESEYSPVTTICTLLLCVLVFENVNTLLVSAVALVALVLLLLIHRRAIQLIIAQT